MDRTDMHTYIQTCHAVSRLAPGIQAGSLLVRSLGLDVVGDQAVAFHHPHTRMSLSARPPSERRRRTVRRAATRTRGASPATGPSFHSRPTAHTFAPCVASPSFLRGSAIAFFFLRGSGTAGSRGLFLLMMDVGRSGPLPLSLTATEPEEEAGFFSDRALCDGWVAARLFRAPPPGIQDKLSYGRYGRDTAARPALGTSPLPARPSVPSTPTAAAGTAAPAPGSRGTWTGHGWPPPVTESGRPVAGAGAASPFLPLVHSSSHPGNFSSPLLSRSPASPPPVSRQPRSRLGPSFLSS
ncbi:hypothetical protein CDD83_202 [Cordyceps sp. RAO-2017]|nr:hypothetical protein CDD83_202 [Cordyceps sp. RAO-2017]